MIRIVWPPVLRLASFCSLSSLPRLVPSSVIATFRQTSIRSASLRAHDVYLIKDNHALGSSVRVRQSFYAIYLIKWDILRKILGSTRMTFIVRGIKFPLRFASIFMRVSVFFLVFLDSEFVLNNIESLTHILNEMDGGRLASDESNKTLFCIQLQLTAAKLEYEPALASDSGSDEFMQIIVRLMDDVCSMAHQIDRIAQPVASVASAAAMQIAAKTKRSFKGK